MTFTPQEAEVILRQGWTDAEQVGGFHSAAAQHQTLAQLTEDFGAAALHGWTLIGEATWWTYEEGGATYLFVNLKDDTLWSLATGSTVYGSYGDTFDEIEPTTMEEWLETVSNCHKEEYGCG